MKREEKKKGDMGSRKREATLKEGMSKRTMKEDFRMTGGREHPELAGAGQWAPREIPSRR